VSESNVPLDTKLDILGPSLSSHSLGYGTDKANPRNTLNTRNPKN